MLQKAGKDLLTLKGWRPIALLLCISKILEVIVARKIGQAVQEHKLLPQNQMAQAGRSTGDALRYILQSIQTAWKKGKVALVLSLDMTGAFDKVNHERLIHNLRCRRIPYWTTAFIASFL